MSRLWPHPHAFCGLPKLDKYNIGLFDLDIIMEKLEKRGLEKVDLSKFKDYFNTEFKIRYFDKHFNLDYEQFVVDAIVNIFQDNIWVLSLLSEVMKEQVKFQDLIYKNYRAEFENDGPIQARYGGTDIIQDEDTATSTEKTESYSYGKLSKMMSITNLRKKDYFDSLFKDINKLFWQVICPKGHAELFNG